MTALNCSNYKNKNKNDGTYKTSYIVRKLSFIESFIGFWKKMW